MDADYFERCLDGFRSVNTGTHKKQFHLTLLAGLNPGYEVVGLAVFFAGYNDAQSCEGDVLDGEINT